MENLTPNVAIACTLTDQEFKERRALARQTILRKVADYHPIANGLSLSFLYSKETRIQVEEFIELEKGCCGFLTFDLEPEQNLVSDQESGQESGQETGEASNLINLSITGPTGATKFIDIFVNLIKETEADRDEKITA